MGSRNPNQEPAFSNREKFALTVGAAAATAGAVLGGAQIGEAIADWSSNNRVAISLENVVNTQVQGGNQNQAPIRTGPAEIPGSVTINKIDATDPEFLQFASQEGSVYDTIDAIEGGQRSAQEPVAIDNEPRP